MTVSNQASASDQRFLTNVESGSFVGYPVMHFLWFLSLWITGLLFFVDKKMVLFSWASNQKTSSNSHLLLPFAICQVVSPDWWLSNTMGNRTGSVSSWLKLPENDGFRPNYYIGSFRLAGFAFLAYPRLYLPPDQ